MSPFRPGIDVLLQRHSAWLRRRRVGLVSHPAAVSVCGALSAELLRGHPGVRLMALFGPEHGFWGAAGAGEPLRHRRHPSWRLPVYSLYGPTRRPTRRMFRRLDAIVVDLQDLGARPYTFCSTLRYVLEAAAEYGLTAIVADRPIPLPRVVDGPMLDPAFESFVGAIRVPMLYGMTQGELALWLNRDLGLDLDLRIACMDRYRRNRTRQPDWPPWIPPSPGIRAWESAYTYTATVFTEALGAVHNGRTTNLAFQVFGAPWMRGEPVCEWLNAARLPGVVFYPHRFLPGSGPLANRSMDGVRIFVAQPDTFRPVTTAVHIIACLQSLYGWKRVWNPAETRVDFFDKLFGTDIVRHQLQAGVAPARIAAGWEKDTREFRAARKKCLLYGT